MGLCEGLQLSLRVRAATMAADWAGAGTGAGSDQLQHPLCGERGVWEERAVKMQLSGLTPPLQISGARNLQFYKSPSKNLIYTEV